MRRDARPQKPPCHLQRPRPVWAERDRTPARPAMRLIRLADETDFDGWRKAARALRAAAVPPEQVRWIVGESGGELFGEEGPPPAPEAAFAVPRDFVELAEAVACH